MPTSQEWWAKSTLSLAAAQTCLRTGNLPAVANRLWYAIYQGVHAVLIRRGYTPSQMTGNWHHSEIPGFYITVICRQARRRPAIAALNKARVLIPTCWVWRNHADYDRHEQLVESELQRATAQVRRMLQYIQEEMLS